MIDFRATNDQNGTIHFRNSYNQTLKTYAFTDLEQYVLLYGLNEDVLGVKTELQTYIDLEWFEVTEKFYHYKNPSQFKSRNTVQKTKAEIS